MRALVQMLAARSGQLLSIATLSNELGLGATTVKKYVALLEEVFLVKRTTRGDAAYHEARNHDQLAIPAAVTGELGLP